MYSKYTVLVFVHSAGGVTRHIDVDIARRVMSEFLLCSVVDGGHGARSTHAPSTAGGSGDEGSDSEVDQMSAFDVSMARCALVLCHRSGHRCQSLS